MNTPFDPRTGRWRIAWPGRVARHDLVYLTPPQDPLEGIPLGNGDVGVLAWCEGSKLILAVNKCDLWDDGAGEDFANWKPEQEEFSTALRHACRLVVDFELPVFDPLYLSDCRGRLRLADAALELRVRGPFGAVAIEAFVDHEDGVLCCRVRQQLRQAVPVVITLERLGSRTFSHWYSLVRRDPALGLAGTAATAGKGRVGVTHRLTTGTFAVAAGIEPEGRARVETVRLHRHASRVSVAAAGRAAFTLYACVTEPMAAGAARTAAQRLDRARATGRDGLLPRHRRCWRSFWERSLMECGSDYLDNLWHLTMYYANASQRGRYPGRFINGLWTFSRDVQNWNFYFHWNQQQIYWPLNAAGHHDLNESYLRYRFDSLPLAQADARRHFGSDGAFVSDVSERRGYNSLSELANHTPVMQIAMDFWRQYSYTGDLEFLRSRALPYLLAAARFTESLFTLGEDGRYHARESTAYEGWIPIRDCITVLACARSLFTAALAAVELTGTAEPRAVRWREILARLAPLPVMPAGREMIGREQGELRLRRGLFKGQAALSAEILAVGYDVRQGRVTSSRLLPEAPATTAWDDLDTLARKLDSSGLPRLPDHAETRCYDGIFPSVEYSTVFPSGPLGLADRDSRRFRAAVNTVKLYAPAVMGWDPCAIVMARLGLGSELWESLAAFAERWQFYCNGWGHYGPDSNMRLSKVLRFSKCQVRDAGLDQEARDRPESLVWLEQWPFRHMGMESMSVLACAMNEALLQSDDRVIRVAPAVAPGQNARFSLHAVGGFVVSAEVRRGRVAWVSVCSLQGHVCRLENPWPRAYQCEGGTPVGGSAARVLEFATRTGQVITFVPSRRAIGQWQTTAVAPLPNQTAKVSPTGSASLGLPRMF